MIVGIGIDMIEVKRVLEKVEKHNGFKEKVFSQAEIEFCRTTQNGENYAARFAAKEAFLKATGFGFLLGIDLAKIEVVNDVNGRPSIVLHDDLKIQAEKNGWNNIHVSLSHLKDIACAVVIIER